MHQDDLFKHWTHERSAVEAQMDEILAGGVPTSAMERQTRQVQFMALIERRDVAARLLLDDLRRRQARCPVIE